MRSPSLGFKRAAESFVNRPIDEVITTWGYPDMTRPLPNGERSYSWDNFRRTYYSPHVAYGYHDLFEPTSCWISLVADPNGIVRHYKIGDDCYAYEEPPMRTE